MDRVVHVGLLGFGTVGTGVIRILQDNAALIGQRAGSAIKISKILVRDLGKNRQLTVDAEITVDPDAVIQDPDIDIGHFIRSLRFITRGRPWSIANMMAPKVDANWVCL